ncbi:MAG: hypothetical protein IKN38_01130 [Clostridia bacterium]|nr:hypothetical protein [Clostridia bacterium]
MKRGFITIATGKKHYYEIAANLLKSYRHFTNHALPFAVIAEEENEYTALFDDIIITKKSTHSFMDKFLLLKNCPYDETIFFDADCLAYGDLNVYFDFFKDSTDFSTIGVNVDKYAGTGAWYNVEDIWKYGDMIEYKSRVHAGVMYFRKSDSLEKVYSDCIDIYSNYDKLHFHTCEKSCDEAVFGIAMPMNNMKARREDPKLFACLPCVTYIKTDMLKGKLSFRTDWDGFTENSVLLHFGTNQTFQPLYRFDVECLNYMIGYENKKAPLIKKFLYNFRARYCYLKITYGVRCFFTRVKRKLFGTKK